MIKIDKNVPIPSNYMGRKMIYPFNEMEIGDSFAVSFETNDEARRKQVSLSNNSNRNRETWEKRKKFITRVDYVKKEVRIWRVK